MILSGSIVQVPLSRSSVSDFQDHFLKLLLPGSGLVLGPLLDSYFFDLAYVPFPVAAENESEYLGDEVVQRFAIEVLIAFGATLIVQFGAAFAHLAS